MEDKRVVTQIRLPEPLHTFVQSEAMDLGVSQNAMLCMLLALGKRAYLFGLSEQEPSG